MLQKLTVVKQIYSTQKDDAVYQKPICCL